MADVVGFLEEAGIDFDVLEHATLGSGVRPNELRRTVRDRNVPQLGRIGTATNCNEMRVCDDPFRAFFRAVMA